MDSNFPNILVCLGWGCWPQIPSFYWSSTCRTNMTGDKQMTSVPIIIPVRRWLSILMWMIHQGSGKTLASNISHAGGENGGWKASKLILTHTHSGWKWGGHQTGLYFYHPGNLVPPHVLLSHFCAAVKTRTDFSPKAECYIISSVLCFCSFVLFSYMVSLQSEAIKPVSHKPDRSRPSSV